MSSAQRPSLRALTGVRFLAALHVVAFHYAPREGLPAWLDRLLSAGSHSVTLFFILSGFILAYSHLGAQEAPKVERRAFWAARFARVYPVYLLGLVLMAPPWIDGVRRALGGLSTGAFWELAKTGLAALTLTQAWGPGVACVWNCPGWSLSVEAFFYLLFPLLCLPLVHAKPRGLWRAAAATLGSTAVLVLLWLWVERWLATSPTPPWGPDTWLKVAAYNPLLRLPQFLLGIVLGRLFCLRVKDGQGAGPAAPAQTWVAAGASLVLFAAPVSGAALAFRDLALMPTFALLIWGLAYGGGSLAWLLGRSWAVRLGEASYGLYILHNPLYFYLRLADHRWGPGLAGSSPRRFFAVYVALSVLASMGVFLWLEEPARRWLRTRMIRRPAASPSASAA
ncbi:acyltransferase family protein [Stigmatella aurantiaca]|uniref:3-O-acyltransferase n=1 Tax=Stigmatella aurantiaca (strain DW4/3-1) TaxID=378806 RepID=Q097E8_STIAD|nr:acyltransferase [Stigmatella aurantiaca]ADO69851.1 Acyltransferase family protein [Stigmatella aurantiaca DW4/3-1]EAU67913.1 3-O-acyltransferase [Stigmatella aurantiaca DW4/3-1]